MNKEQKELYWKHKREGRNSPTKYITPNKKRIARTEQLLDYFNQYFCKTHKILELGCNAGRNLKALKDEGFNNIEGVEINADAIRLLRTQKGLENIKVKECSLHNLFPITETYDVIFTMAVFEHIADDPLFFSQLQNNTNFLITIEDEFTKSDRHKARNYKKLFESFGFRQIESKRFLKGLPLSFVRRMFIRKEKK